jgi:hypothetical protein
MQKTIYQNNDVVITIERKNVHEAKVNINGDNLISISISEADQFKKELTELLDRYRI